jgi:hypothetical protein
VTASDYTEEPCPFCKAPVIWARDTVKGTTIPVNPERSYGGTHALRPGPTELPLAVKLTPSKAFGVQSRTLHVTTCTKPKLLRQHYHAA